MSWIPSDNFVLFAQVGANNVRVVLHLFGFTDRNQLAVCQGKHSIPGS